MECGAFVVLPESNALLGDAPEESLRTRGLGPQWRRMRDNLLLETLSWMDERALCRLSCASRAMYLLAGQDSVWRDVVLRRTGGQSLKFRGSWKQTFLELESGRVPHPPCLRGCKYYSDDLFHLLLCCDFDLKRMCPGILGGENIPRISARHITVQQFIDYFEKPNRPVVITGAVDHWPAMKKWTREYLLQVSSDKPPFRASSAQACMPAMFTLADYLSYADSNRDEVPFYLFDKEGCSKMLESPTAEPDYTVPPYFDSTERPTTDLFRVLGPARPDHRWLIIGPKRSGSIFHIDPNQTHAWNALVAGRKKWVFYPPHSPPPGVLHTEDFAEAVVPVSTAEWLLTFWSFHLERRVFSALHPVYDDVPRLAHGGVKDLDLHSVQVNSAPASTSTAPLECIQETGDLVFVPHGYWHMVWNLTDTVALTHNYCATTNLTDVLRFLHDTPEQITGLGGRLEAPSDCTDCASGGDLYSSFLRELPQVLDPAAIAEHVRLSQLPKGHTSTSTGEDPSQGNGSGRSGISGYRNFRSRGARRSTADAEERRRRRSRPDDNNDDDSANKRARKAASTDSKDSESVFSSATPAAFSFSFAI